MSTDAFLVVAFLLGYLFGSIPFGLILTRLAGTEDLRTIGSGSIGATNVLRTGSKPLAVATLLGDALKGTLAVVIAGYYGGPNAAMLAGLGAFLGHLYPVWLKFKGGKGIATYIGVLIGLFWPAAIVFCVMWLATAFSLFVALGADRSLRHAAVPVVVRPPGAGLAVRGADAANVLRAPRKHQAVAGGDRKQDRGEIVVSLLSSFRGARSASPESILTIVVMDSGPAPSGASRNDENHRASASSTNRAAANALASSP
jgi:acyl-phosphate glycerol 3-phosphate acyltransferase